MEHWSQNRTPLWLQVQCFCFLHCFLLISTDFSTRINQRSFILQSNESNNSMDLNYTPSFACILLGGQRRDFPLFFPCQPIPRACISILQVSSSTLQSRSQHHTVTAFGTELLYFQWHLEPTHPQPENEREGLSKEQLKSELEHNFNSWQIRSVLKQIENHGFSLWKDIIINVKLE